MFWNKFSIYSLSLLAFRLPTTTSNPIKKSDPISEDVWEIPCDGLEVFTSKGVISSEKVKYLLKKKYFFQ